MKLGERQTRSALMELFEQHGFRPRTDLGQNFLIDLNILEYIVEQAHIGPEDVVLEIGAGTGGITTFLAQNAATVVSVEVDTKMYQLVKPKVEAFENVTLLHCDALKNKNNLSPQVLKAVEEKLSASPGSRLKLVSNLPYNIATPVVSNLVATDLPWERMVVTIQYELGQRMASRPGRSHYSALSVWLQSQCDVKMLKKLPPSVFWPRPKVNSAIMRLFPNSHKRDRIRKRPFFQDFIRRLFHQRRKLARSVLVGMYRKQLEKNQVDAVIESMKLNTKWRAEELDVSTLVELANRFYEQVEGDSFPSSGQQQEGNEIE
jgi:16S rRNA (adenine1518-N6/adenine1519-N6)-dimethyltransferase